jgi:ABC-2 type transport system ATP-binding protein
MRAIEVRDLTVCYGPVAAVNGLSFTAEAGEVLALLGPNGAGKTTTVETLEGYHQPRRGQVRVLGLDPIRDRRRVTPDIGVMLQDGGVYPGIRPLEALRLHASFYDDADDPDALLERVGLTHVRRSTWRQMSGGEQQRLSLALALVGKPKVAFLDEPTAGVDVAGRHLIRQLVRELCANGVCVLLTSHDLGEAEKVADRVVIIDRGIVIMSGTPAELMNTGGGEEIRFGAPPGLDVAALGKALMAAVEECAPGEYLVHVPPTPAHVAALTAWLAERDLPLADLRAGRQRLEDVFLRLTAITGEMPAIRIADSDDGDEGNHGDPAQRRHRSGAA